MRMCRFIPTLLLLALPALGLTTQLSAQQATLVGTVTDAEFGTPVAQARVQVLGGSGVETLTNDQGRYTFQLPPGSYSLLFEVVGYPLTREDDVTVSAGGATTFDVVLESTAFQL
ncbi:MAG TPA: TonB-dependent receptor, partial [Gemmatimonadetes bacterium]|nr:TonB-dependent receptor [Gemmatimonadota bacterium]